MVSDFSVARRLRASVWTFMLVAALSGTAHATTVVSKSFADLCAEAEMVFSATVTAVRSQRVDPGRGDLETLVTFADIDALLGVIDSPLTLHFAGGVVDGVREEFLGVPRFTVGERVVLFARKSHQLSPVVGLSQGCFRVVESATGATVASADGRPLTAIDGLVMEADGVGGASSGGPLPLGQFLDAVRRELSAQGRRD